MNFLNWLKKLFCKHELIEIEIGTNFFVVGCKKCFKTIAFSIKKAVV